MISNTTSQSYSSNSISGQFESINLDSHSPAQQDHISDDIQGKVIDADDESLLDPTDYITQLDGVRHDPNNNVTLEEQPHESTISIAQEMIGKARAINESGSDYPDWGLGSSFNAQNLDQSYYHNSPPISMFLSTISPSIYNNMGFNSLIAPGNYGSIAHSNQNSIYNESPLQFLSKKEEVINAELNNNLEFQNRSLKSGDGKIMRARNMILQNFEQLQEVNLSFTELYEKEKEYRISLAQNFQKWSYTREKIILKIKDIRSTNNDVGKKFQDLTSKASIVDKEIQQLEKRLAQMKKKRSLLKDEINETNSVIESRASSYIEALKSIESQGESAINRLSNMYSSIIDLPMVPPITRIPETLSSSSLFQFSESQSMETPSLSDSHAMPSSGSQSSSQVLGQSDTLKNKFALFFNKFSNLEDNAHNDNTVASKIDIEPVMESLKLQIEVISDQISHHEQQGNNFKESIIIWKDVLDYIRQMEKQLVEITSKISSPQDIPKSTENLITSVIKSTLINLKSRLVITRNLSLYDVERVLLNEMQTLSTGIQVITGSNDSFIDTILQEIESEKRINVKDNNWTNSEDSKLNSPISQNSLLSGQRNILPLKNIPAALPTFVVSDPAKFVPSQSFATKAMKGGIFSKAVEKQVKKD